MKKYLLPILILLAITFLAWAGYFSWKNFRGAGPALKPPSEDIADIIENKIEDNKTITEAINTSGFPLDLPDGFSISIYEQDLKSPRVLTRDPAGNLLVSLTKDDRVVALPDRNNDGKADEVITVAKNLNRPHGLAFKCHEDRADDEAPCDLYIAETHQISSYAYDQKKLEAFNPKKLVDLPDDGRHSTRTIRFRQPPDDNELFVSIGSSCDTCLEEDERRAGIWTLNVKTKEFKPFAKGLRNSVFMDFHPETGQLWATEMGRDHLGDDLPPDEINIILGSLNYGWPTCYGDNIHDTKFDTNTYIRNPCQEPFETGSHIDIPAHSSPLGISFFPKEGWPESFHRSFLVAHHGSWNRSTPVGYKLVKYDLNESGEIVSFRDFISGWLRPDFTSIGRPVDIMIEPNGVIYVTDDKAGVIYRIEYVGVESECKPTGCSFQLCSEDDLNTTCEFMPEYECYRSASCERQVTGECGWTKTDELTTCLDEKTLTQDIAL